MRKLLLSLGCLALVAGLVIAADTVTVVKFDKDSKKLTVKDKDGKEKTYEVTDKTKFTSKGKDGEKEWEYSMIEKMLTREPKEGEKKRTLTFEIETKDGKVTEAKLKMGGKGGKGGGKGDKKDN